MQFTKPKGLVIVLMGLVVAIPLVYLAYFFATSVTRVEEIKAATSDTEIIVEKPQEALLDNPSSIEVPTVSKGLITLSVFSCLVALSSILMSYRLYTSRIKLDLSGALVPEKWADVLMDANKIGERSIQTLGDLTEFQGKIAKFIEQKFGQIEAGTKQNKELLLTFQNSLDEKDLEIKRYKDGYDTKISKKFLSRLAELHQNGQIMSDANPQNKEVKNLVILILDILEAFGAELYRPQMGVDFADISEFVEPVGTTESSAAGLAKGQISEVVSPGYRINGGEKPIVLKRARIKYYLPNGE